MFDRRVSIYIKNTNFKAVLNLFVFNEQLRKIVWRLKPGKSVTYIKFLKLKFGFPTSLCGKLFAMLFLDPTVVILDDQTH